MDKYKKFHGLILIIIASSVLFLIAWHVVQGQVVKLQDAKTQHDQKTQQYEQSLSKKRIVENKITKMHNALVASPKKIYAPLDSDLGNDTLFFTLYNDVIEMIHANSVKIKSIDYEYNPESDKFVEHGKDAYFVCQINFELISNYVNLGKLIQDIYQYPYYINIQNFEIKPYEKDKKVLISNLTLRLYAHTSPEEN